MLSHCMSSYVMFFISHVGGNDYAGDGLSAVLHQAILVILIN